MRDLGLGRELGKRFFLPIPAFIFLVLFFSGCAWLPKIHVINDALSNEEHLDLGLIYEKDGELDLAEREYKAAQPLALAYMGLGNVMYQKGEVRKALKYYRLAWQREKIPAVANNLAWVLLMEGGDLEEALETARQAVILAKEGGLEQQLIDNYQGTLNQVEQAIKSSSLRSQSQDN
ncbi:MAG: hypothetical protein LBS44_00865 [Deltaproteobacteria bacterium]|nr:hypothetical protein [Deltaproteobacteria bacterium]